MIGLVGFIYILSELTSLVSRVVRFVAKLDLIMLIKAINARFPSSKMALLRWLKLGVVRYPKQL